MGFYIELSIIIRRLCAKRRFSFRGKTRIFFFFYVWEACAYLSFAREKRTRMFRARRRSFRDVCSTNTSMCVLDRCGSCRWHTVIDKKKKHERAIYIICDGMDARDARPTCTRNDDSRVSIARDHAYSIIDILSRICSAIFAVFIFAVSVFRIVRGISFSGALRRVENSINIGGQNKSEFQNTY